MAAVSAIWLKKSSVVRQRFVDIAQQETHQVMAWILFFIALHDLGKFDIRFQLKAPRVLEKLRQGTRLDIPEAVIVRNYWHGEYAYFWVYEDFAQQMEWKPPENVWEEAPGEERREAWKPWLQAVAGHHGKEPIDCSGLSKPLTSPDILEYDRQARFFYVSELEKLFLKPAELSIDDVPPPVDLLFLAGFCSVCDWLGSTTHNRDGEDRFTFQNAEEPLSDYLEKRKEIARTLIAETGLLSKTITKGGIADLFPQLSELRQIQILVEKLPIQSGLTLMEASTGSGKTEAALAYASHLLVKGIVESIVFALPTQATANAMLKRLLDVAGNLFENTDMVLAHGKAGFNPHFTDLKNNASRQTLQDAEHEMEAAVQCARWLSQSRKRVFLGQIGVCTVDQVLISVLPVRHRFVRGFGIGKSVLIIDEVHAYDSYMYGLLNKVLQHQKNMYGSVILLSATLPAHQRKALINAWDGDSESISLNDDYPLITHASGRNTEKFALSDTEKQRLAKLPGCKEVQIAWRETSDVLPDDELLIQIVGAAQKGANVVIICNLVADAQELRLRLIEKTTLPVDLFHSRFRFKDRQAKEEHVLEAYGKTSESKRGRILVATQVVEQSLDLDFDWMLTQLCPVDLLFQRLGRLHRHDRNRPKGFDQPQCTVLLPENRQYELHKLIYGNKNAPNSRILWRTEQLVRKNPTFSFPDVYRPLIEKAYCEKPWSEEPEEIIKEYEEFFAADYASHLSAHHMTDVHNVWNDDDNKVSLLTRDGEMNLNIVPVVESSDGLCFLDTLTPISALEEWEQAEEIMMNTVPVPASWKNKGLPQERDGLIWLVMKTDGQSPWCYISNKAVFTYTPETGLMMEQS